MAKKGARIVLFFAAVAVLFALATATEFTVGDDWGWTVGVDYAAWAEGKKFRIGDTLVFNYTVGAHTVVKVNGSGFAKCETSPNSGVLTSGNDRITLTAAGKKWYICGVGNHCESGQKLNITVLPKTMVGGGPAPAPWPSSLPPMPRHLPFPPTLPPSVETPGYWAPSQSALPLKAIHWPPALPPAVETPGIYWPPALPPAVETPGSYWPPALPPAAAETPGSYWPPTLPPTVETPGSHLAPSESSEPEFHYPKSNQAPSPAPSTTVQTPVSWPFPVPSQPPSRSQY